MQIPSFWLWDKCTSAHKHTNRQKKNKMMKMLSKVLRLLQTLASTRTGRLFCLRLIVVTKLRNENSRLTTERHKELSKKYMHTIMGARTDATETRAWPVFIHWLDIELRHCSALLCQGEIFIALCSSCAIDCDCSCECIHPGSRALVHLRPLNKLRRRKEKNTDMIARLKHHLRFETSLWMAARVV